MTDKTAATTLLSYHNDSKLKAEMVEEMLKHQEQDQIIKGTYAQENGIFKACAVGCGVHSYNTRKGTHIAYNDHGALAKAIGIPEWLFRLQDTLFEGLPDAEAKEFPVLFYKALPIGKDLESVRWKFCAFILKENIERVLTLKIDDKLKQQVVESIQGVLKLHENAITSGEWDGSAAESAARSAARSAWSAAEAAESAARSAWPAAYKKYADELLRLFEDAALRREEKKIKEKQ